MSGSFSTYLETALLNHVFGGVPYAEPTGVFVALFIAAPPGDGSTPGAGEVSGGGYVRMQATFAPPVGTPPSMANASPVQWPTATADWGLITAGALYDAAHGGNFLGSGLLVDPTDRVTPAPKQLMQGDVFRIAISYLVVGFLLPPAGAGAGPAAITPVSRVGPISGEVIRAARQAARGRR